MKKEDPVLEVYRDVMIAALRCYQAVLFGQQPDLLALSDIATSLGQHAQVMPEEIDEMCEALNFGDIRLVR